MPDLDPLLQRALATYLAEPDPHLERRVLARIRRPHWLRWTAIAAAAAVLAIVAKRPAPPTERIPSVKPSLAAEVNPAVAKPDRQGGDISRPLAVAAKRPTAARTIPISPQELHLVRTAQTHPGLFANAPALGEPIQPLITEPIDIKPLTPLTN